MRISVRTRLTISLFVLIPLGIGTKFYTGPAAEWIQGHAGGVLYVVFWIVAVNTVIPSLSSWKTATGVLVLTCLVEITQLWKPPILHEVRQTFAGRALIGSTFGWKDFPHYGIGALLGALFVRQMKKTAPDD